MTSWPAARPLRSGRLELEPLRPDHADEAAVAFADPALHAFTGGTPATADQLRARYARQVAGCSPDGTEGWLNWMVRRRDDGVLVGTVQATLRRDPADQLTAELAWVVAVPHQGAGCAREATSALAGWLSGQGVQRLTARVHPAHAASAGVARALGLRPTPRTVDGEVCWSS